MREEKIRYLEMIQSTITRMASNSFSLKSWTVTLIAGILALSSDEADKMFFLIAYVPLIVFWFLDSYYLKLERTFRSLFDYIRTDENADIDFDMSPKRARDRGKNNKELNFISCIFSKSQWLFYVPIGVIVGVVIGLSKII